MIDEAIYNTHPSVVTILESTDAYDEQGTLVVLDTALVDAEVDRIVAEAKSNEYKKLRFTEYSKLDQFEMQFDDQRDSTTTWVDAINAIKLRFPK